MKIMKIDTLNFVFANSDFVILEAESYRLLKRAISQLLFAIYFFYGAEMFK